MIFIDFSIWLNYIERSRNEELIQRELFDLKRNIIKNLFRENSSILILIFLKKMLTLFLQLNLLFKLITSKLCSQDNLSPRNNSSLIGRRSCREKVLGIVVTTWMFTVRESKMMHLALNMASKGGGSAWCIVGGASKRVERCLGSSNPMNSATGATKVATPPGSRNELMTCNAPCQLQRLPSLLRPRSRIASRHHAWVRNSLSS